MQYIGYYWSIFDTLDLGHHVEGDLFSCSWVMVILFLEWSSILLVLGVELVLFSTLQYSTVLDCTVLYFTVQLILLEGN